MQINDVTSVFVAFINSQIHVHLIWLIHIQEALNIYPSAPHKLRKNIPIKKVTVLSKLAYIPENEIVSKTGELTIKWTYVISFYYNPLKIYIVATISMKSKSERRIRQNP